MFELVENDVVIDRVPSMEHAKQYVEGLADERGLTIKWRPTFDQSASGVATDSTGRSVTVFTIRKVAE